MVIKKLKQIILSLYSNPLFFIRFLYEIILWSFLMTIMWEQQQKKNNRELLSIIANKIQQSKVCTSAIQSAIVALYKCISDNTNVYKWTNKTKKCYWEMSGFSRTNKNLTLASKKWNQYIFLSIWILILNCETGTMIIAVNARIHIHTCIKFYIFSSLHFFFCCCNFFYGCQ